MISPYKYNHGTGFQRRALLGCAVARLEIVDWRRFDRAYKFTHVKGYDNGRARLYRQLIRGATQQIKLQRRTEKYWDGRNIRRLPCNKYMYQFGQKTYLHTMLNRFAYTLTKPQTVIQ